MRYSKYPFLLCSVACCLASPSLFGTALTVNVAGDTNTATGGSFAGTSGDLRGVINHINQNPGSHTVSFSLGASNTINLSGMLPVINLNAANTVIIDGANGGNKIIIDGGNTHPAFFAEQGTVTIQNINVQNVRAIGGAGGVGRTGGGGGMGAGAALFVDRAAVTISNMSVSSANATGGGGGDSEVLNFGGGGGGGLNGGNGGDSGVGFLVSLSGGGGGLGGSGGVPGVNFTDGHGGGGGINGGAGRTGAGGGSGAAGSAGGVLGAAGAGVGGGGGGAGGATAGGGGGGANVVGGAGGGGGVGGTAGGITAGNGGFGGGGGGYSTGGNGGFGGGGGGGTSNFTGGAGGFGGGGGAGGNAGAGGFGGGGSGGNGSVAGVGGGQGSGNNGGGGGGAGFGGAIFVNNGVGGSLTIKGPFTTGSGLNANSSTQGASSIFSGSAGWHAGDDIFFLTGSSLTLDPNGSTITLNGTIADDSAASFVGAGSGVTLGSAAGAALNIGAISSAAGTAILATANTYSGGTTIHKGILSIQNNNSLGSGALTFAQSGTTLHAGANNLIIPNLIQLTANGIVDSDINTITIPTAISGAGSLTKIGGGTLIVTGANNYSGGTTVTAGTLQGDTTSLQGNILNNATVAFNQTTTGDFADQISGTGSLNKIGSGQLRLLGANTYTGPTTVSAGMLTLNGSLTSSVTVLPGASLNGSGSIQGEVTVGGMLGPGEMIGTLEVVGNITFQNGSTFEVEANPTTADVLDVDAAGNIIIQPGATISVIPTPATYGVNTVYNVAIAGESGGVVIGTFSNVTNSYPLITATVVYRHTSSPTLEETALDVNQISLLLNYLPFSTAFPGGNTGAIGGSLDGFNPPPGSDLAFVIGQLYFLPTTEALADALNQMQPSVLNSISLAQQNGSLFVSSAFTKHTSDLRLTRSPCTVLGEKQWQVWGDGSVDRARQNGDHQNVGFNSKTNLGAGGFDYRLTKHFYLGALGAYTHTSVNSHDHLAKGFANTYYGGLYGCILYPRFFANLSLVGDFTDYHSKRRVQFGDIDRQPRGHHHGYGAIAHLDLGASLPAERRAQCYPYGALDYVYQHEKGYTETTAQSLNNNIRARNLDLLRSEIGLQGRYCSSIGQDVIIPSAKIGWVYEARFQGKKINARLVDVPNRYTVVGLYPNRSLLAVGASLTGVLYKQVAHLSVTYEGLFGSGYRSNACNASLNFQF